MKILIDMNLSPGWCELLAATQANGPSVVQVRTQHVALADLGPLVVKVLRACEAQLMQGALVSVDEARARVHVLPLSTP